MLASRFALTVRKPVATLPSGAQVSGMGDAVCVNDPITGQGSNNALEVFKVVHDSIVARGNATFERYWDYASTW
ncbi:hypothetical protein SAMN03159371_00843 [Variovorax sp. NFACC28]|nr:hypothetical protein SAMN03159371_00843 [Variovorax sp. NFACC28]SEG09187.1 hypothetical protein SAMN03159365_01398 [Variovorax sp. NFACC29]SFF77650.1 hypothetical protein SAMN03159447_00026 [Variovorax sp. NFACC27]